MSTPTFVTVAGRRTRVRIEGDPARPPVVLLHGIGRSLEDWGPQFPRLRDTHRVIALDLPGSGFSARSRQPTTLEVLAGGVLETLDAVGEQRPVHAVGNSLGGAVAMQLVVSASDRVASLGLVNSAGFGAEVALPLRLLAAPVLGGLAVRRTTRGSALMAERLSFADPALATSARVDHALAIAAQPDTAAVLLETVRALATVRRVRSGWRDRLTGSVAALSCPTLVLWGDQDRVLPPHHLDAARRLFPHAETELFAGVGHMPQIECPDVFASRVLAFLADADRATSSAKPRALPSSKRGSRRGVASPV
jgi:pimeloyl-ACP methyl ester carboxylesterase